MIFLTIWQNILGLELTIAVDLSLYSTRCFCLRQWNECILLPPFYCYSLLALLTLFYFEQSYGTPVLLLINIALCCLVLQLCLPSYTFFSVVPISSICPFPFWSFFYLSLYFFPLENTALTFSVSLSTMSLIVEREVVKHDIWDYDTQTGRRKHRQRHSRLFHYWPNLLGSVFLADKALVWEHWVP